MHSPGDTTTWPGVDVTWQPLQRACLASERLFSSAADKRTWLLADNPKCLVFSKADLMWNRVNVNDETRWWMMDGKRHNGDKLQLDLGAAQSSTFDSARNFSAPAENYGSTAIMHPKLMQAPTGPIAGRSCRCMTTFAAICVSVVGYDECDPWG